jgi:hypothetical protein
MSTKRAKEIRVDVMLMLSASVDAVLREHGFVRPPKSLVYKKSLTSVVQKIPINVESHPSYNRNALACILPAMWLEMKEVKREAMSLVKGDDQLSRFFSGAPDLILNQPVSFAAPKEAREQWYFYEEGSAMSIWNRISEFLSRWVLPLFSQLESPSGLVERYEADDCRIIKQQHFYIYIAAAYRVIGQPERARDVVHKHFSKPGIRKQYEVFVQSVLG